jgi:hypothetical protein
MCNFYYFSFFSSPLFKVLYLFKHYCPSTIVQVVVVKETALVPLYCNRLGLIYVATVLLPSVVNSVHMQHFIGYIRVLLTVCVYV